MCTSFIIYVLKIFWSHCGGMWDLSSPTRDQTHAPCIRSMKSLTPGLPGKSLNLFVFFFFFLMRIAGDSDVCQSVGNTRLEDKKVDGPVSWSVSGFSQPLTYLPCILLSGELSAPGPSWLGKGLSQCWALDLFPCFPSSSQQHWAGIASVK